MSWETPLDKAAAQHWADSLSLPCLPLTEVSSRADAWLQATPAGLQFVYKQSGASSTLSVDFLKGPLGYRLSKGEGKNQLIARAVGLKKRRAPLKILDATAGLGRDAFVLAALGCEVHMVERSPIMAALLQDGLNRAAGSPKTASTVALLKLTVGDAADVLQHSAWHEPPQVIYLDPMFPSQTKSALTKIEMRIIRDIVGDDQDADALIALSLKKATQRVVVKRARLAPFLSALKPTFLIEGKSSRYDVYLTEGGASQNA